MTTTMTQLHDDDDTVVLSLSLPLPSCPLSHLPWDDTTMQHNSDTVVLFLFLSLPPLSHLPQDNTTMDNNNNAVALILPLYPCPHPSHNNAIVLMPFPLPSPSSCHSPPLWGWGPLLTLYTPLTPSHFCVCTSMHIHTSVHVCALTHTYSPMFP